MVRNFLLLIATTIALAGCSSFFETTAIPDLKPTVQTEANIELPAVASGAQNGELSAAQIFEHNANAVFTIYASFDNEIFWSVGSGFFITDTGIGVTNHHVMDGWPYAYIFTHNGDTFDISGFYNYDDVGDVAIIQVAGRNFQFLTRGDSTAARIGETVFAIGSPLGYHNTFSTGIISRFDDITEFDGYEVHNMIQITAPISDGSSGGALLNDRGQVIGITSAGYDAFWAQQINFAIPISSVEPLAAAATELSPLPIGEVLVVDENEIIGNWVWWGGTYNFYPDGTGNRIWDGEYADFNWRVSAAMLALEILGDEDEQWILSDIYENNITVGGALFTRVANLEGAEGIMVGTWNWEQGRYTFFPTGLGSRDWSGVEDVFQWHIQDGFIHFELSMGEAESWTINIIDENTVEIGGALFVRS